MVKAMIFPVVMYGCEIWTIKKAECRRIYVFVFVLFYFPCIYLFIYLFIFKLYIIVLVLPNIKMNPEFMFLNCGVGEDS